MVTLDHLKSAFDLAVASPNETSLLELLNACNACNIEVFKIFKNAHSIDVIYRHLISNDESVGNLCCKIIQKIAEMSEPSYYLVPHGVEMCHILSSGNDCSLACILKLLDRATASDPQIIFQLPSDLFKYVILNCSKELEVYELSQKIIKNVCTSLDGLQFFLSDENLDTLKSCTSVSEIVKFRIIECLVDIASQSNEVFNALNSKELLEVLFSSTKSDDPLSLANSLHLLGKLAATRHGYVYLEQNGYMEDIVHQAESNLNSAASTILFPVTMKVFCFAGHRHGKDIIEKHSGLIRILSKSLNHHSGIVVSSGLEVIAYLGMGCSGKEALYSSEEFKKVFLTMANLIQRRTDDIKFQSLKCLGQILKCKEDHQQCQQISYSWFNQLGNDPLQLIIDTCKLPFPDARCAGLQVLVSLSSFKWFLTIVANRAGILEYLLDRTTETHKACKDIKFEVIKAIALSPSLEDCFDSNASARIKAHYASGPYYTRADAAVTFEGE